MSISRLSRANLNFLMGLALGVATSFVMTSYRQLTQPYTVLHEQPARLAVPAFLERGDNAMDYHDHEMEHELHDHDDHGMGHVDGHGAAKAVRFEDVHVHQDDDTVARELAKKHRVLCWVMTSPDNLDKKTVHVRNTWGKRCNKLLFMSSEWNSTFPTIGLNVSEGRQHLTAKTMQAFRYVYENHLDDADWFMKADDDTYVIVENLRYFLSSYNTEEPIYFGHTFKALVKPQGYTSGGAGYVLSKEAVRRLATRGNNASLCRQDGGAEDAETGKCLQKLGVKLLPSTDRLGRSRFHCFGPEAHLQGSYPKWFLSYDANGARKGMENISDYAVTFHYMGPSRIYALEYFVYHLRPYGIISKTQTLNLEGNNR
ncbi:hypothetical protein BaRGS_00008058 [Batillaria attramentaria]|uniref:Glycoprotein-N-acetylgalactosamine 3-beta-galactosyltransferase 1 n=1 Tax=Batillaria attramentaria TaxID=370345 RepID=A0ABD0LP61_9CAEN